MQTLIHNATLVLPDRLVEGGWLLIEDQAIAALGEGNDYPNVASKVDADHAFVMPGLIDLHCDGIEKAVMPRPKVMIDPRVALYEVDSRLAASGITTEFHALSLDDGEFGVRAVDFVHDFAQLIKTTHDTLIRHEFHARFEVTSRAGYEAILRLIANRDARMISIMDHTPGQGQYTSVEQYREYLRRTIHASDAEVDALLKMKAEQTAHVTDRVELVTAQARAAGLAIATHDDDSAEKVAGWPRLGVTVSEFPTTIEAALTAHEVGLAVCMGAPNVLRGQSSGGNLSATEAVQAGIVDVLCADYYPSSMLASVFKLAAQNILSLPAATNLVTLNPAKAVGLNDRFGSLEVGKIADLISVRLSQHQLPRVTALYVGGQPRLSQK